MGVYLENEVQVFVDKLRKEYIEKHTKERELDELIVENNIELRDVKGYHGREILELLQNADDAYQKSIDIGEKPDSELVVTIKYIENVLIVTNTGTCFDKEGIKAIVQGNNSPKTGKYIGNKGTGFRSVLNWAKSVRIFSGDYNVEFSKKIALEEFEKIKDLPQIQKQLSKRANLYLSMLALPTNIESHAKNNNTTIEVEIDSDKLNDDYSITKQIDNIDLRILLFLPNISTIEIITENNHVIYKRIFENNSAKTVVLQKVVNECIEIEESFYLFNRKIEKAIMEDNVLKDILLSIAVPKNFDGFKNSNLYSFFPLLDTESPFNCVMHASYALGDHRNTVNANASNKEIIKKQIDFLIDIAKEFVKNGQYDIAHKILVPSNFQANNWKFTSPFSKFEIEEYYLDKLAEGKFFQSVNNTCISVNDGLKIFDGEYPEAFYGEPFKELLNPIKETKVIELIKLLSKRKAVNIYYCEKELLDKINLLTEDLNVAQRVSIFVWWNNNNNVSDLPKLLKDQENQWLSYADECYFLVGNFDEIVLPEWVKISALNQTYQKELFSLTEQSERFKVIRNNSAENKTDRIICQNNLYQTVKFKYRDINSIISTVNSSVDTHEKAVDFIKWLWKNYGKRENWNPPGQSETSGFKYNFPTSNGSGIIDSKKIYFGSDYDNDLASKIFDDTCQAFLPAHIFGIEDIDKEDFIEFIRKFGIKDFPTITTQKVIPIDSYSNNYKKEIRETGDLGSSVDFTTEFILPNIENLFQILENLSTEEIIRWICKDCKLNSFLRSPYVTDGKISYTGNLQREERTYHGLIKNYILAVFNETKWIEINQEKYAPRQVLQNFKVKGNQKFEQILPVISVDMLEEISKKINVCFETVCSVFEIFDFPNKVTDLCSNDFYGLMLNLPSIDFKESVDISKHIYHIIEQKPFTKNFEDSENKRKFFSEGKLLVSYKGQLQYCLVSEAILPSIKIVNKKNFRIVEKGYRTNNENFKRVFGCQEYNNEFAVIKDSIVVSDSNQDFQKYFSCFPKYAQAFTDTENVAKYGRALNITLVCEISILENGQNVKIDEEYACIRETTTRWYITVFDSKFNLNKISEIIETIYTNIANTPGFEANKLGELFRTKEKEDREFLIVKEFGSLSVIEDDYYKNEIKNAFISAIKECKPDFDENDEVYIKIDFENFSNLNNAPFIISILKKIEVDIDDFTNAGFVYTIDLIPYFKYLAEELIYKEKEVFKNVLFTRALNDNNIKESFFETLYRFENFNLFAEYKNSVYFDIEISFKNEFGEWNASEYVSADEKYSENYKKLNPDKLFEEEIANDFKVKRMIYFNEEEKFKNWLEARKKAQEKTSSEVMLDKYEKYRNIIPQCNDIAYTHSRDLKTETIRNGNSRKVYTETDAQKKKHRQKVVGNIGELLIYNYLCEEYGQENVITKSEAFVDLGLLTAGQASSGEYDLSYKDKNGNIHFVEVKTGSNHSFFISENELNFAKGHTDKYELYIVYNLDAEKPDFVKLPEKFWEDERYKGKPIIESIRFDF